MEKKKNGFTLIELLVTIVIMLTLLGIAIVSIINVSNRKKAEAWEVVKRQIETAAEQYFKSNEYLFEGLGDETEATISVGRLVNSDYLNVVTNPKTGKKISYCSQVTVVKKNGVFTISGVNNIEDNINDDDSRCPTGNTMVIQEVGGPAVVHEPLCAYEGNDNWCRGQNDGEDDVGFDGIKITVTSSDAVKIESDCNPSSGCAVSSITDGIEYNDTSNTDVDGKKVTFTATGANGAKTYVYEEYKIDMDKPDGEIGISNNDKSLKYNSNIIDVSLKATDALSKLRDVQYTDTLGKEVYNKEPVNQEKWDSVLKRTLFNSLIKEPQSDNLKIKVSDMAGNIANVTKAYSTYAICKEENLNIKETKTGVEACGASGKYTRTDTIFYNDKLATTYDCGSENELVEGDTCKQECPKVKPDNYLVYKENVDGVKTFSGDNPKLVHDGDLNYWDWWRGGMYIGNSSSNEITTYDTFVAEGKYTYKLTGENGEECKYVYNYDNTPPTCELEVQEGEMKKPESKWYTSSVVKLKFKSYSDPSPYTGASASGIAAYNISSSSTENFENPESENYIISEDGDKTYYGYVKDKIGNTNKCTIKIKKDTTAPEFDYFDSGNDYTVTDIENFGKDVLDKTKNIKDHAVMMMWDLDEKPRLSGTVPLKNKTFTFCLANESDGETDGKRGKYIFHLRAVYKDDLSGPEYGGYWVKVNRAKRTSSPLTTTAKTITLVCDNAGNCRESFVVEDYTITYAYILSDARATGKTGDTIDSCKKGQYRNSFKEIFQDDYYDGKRSLPNLNP